MVSFKLCISDPSTGKTFQREVKDSLAKPFIGLNIGESINGDNFEVSGYEFKITGGSDYCGFPMRRGILGIRKKIILYGGIGFRGGPKGIKRRKTVCGHKIHDKISQINLKVTKSGAKKLADIFGSSEKKEEKAEAKPEVKKETKEQKPEVKKEEKKEVKPKPAVKQEKPATEAKPQKPAKEAKPAEKPKEAKKETKPEVKKEEKK
tara:strand:+ start:1975 stop:2592 length:618 start_codon:yes stop_codon:yes gene_type:complete